MGAILREDERVLSRIQDFIRSRFEANQEDPNFLMEGEEQQEFASLVEEADRVRFSYAGEITQTTQLYKTLKNMLNKPLVVVWTQLYCERYEKDFML